MDFNSYLKVNAQKIEEELHKILSEFVDETKKISPKLLPFAKAFVNSCQGGKRIRGVLCKLGFELASSKFKVQSSKWEKEILKIGAALEILHAAILIHDDIIDQSPVRRNQPSLYKSIGESQALTLGDLGFFLAIRTILASNFKEAEKNNAVELVCKTMIDTALGQIMDIQKDDPVITAKLKTARYTISGPLKLGAILGGAKLHLPGEPTSQESKPTWEVLTPYLEGERLLSSLAEFGENLGITFQIKDDILDKESNLVDQDLKKAVQYAFVAKKMIPGITQDKVMSKLLVSLTEYLVERTK